jgi:hypothetical protein
MIGLGGGPMFFGMASDAFTNANLAPSGMTVETCRTAVDAAKATCATAGAAGLKSTIYWSTSVHALSFACFFFSRYFLRKDMES